MRCLRKDKLKVMNELTTAPAITRKLATHLDRSAKRVYTLVDLFAGCGGLSLGMENAGFTPVFVNELNPDAMASYLLNRNHSLGGMPFSENNALRANDVQELVGSRISQLCSDLSAIPELRLTFPRGNKSRKSDGSDLDIVAGGPPCQGYSGIGHRRSYAVNKKDLPSNQLYERMAEVIGYLRPRLFLFENVRGILNSTWTRGGNDKIWPDILKRFRSIPGYHVRWKLVHAKDYGVPQNRPRVLMIGIRDDLIRSSTLTDISNHPDDAVACGFLPKPEHASYPNLIDLLRID